jgi:transcriptional regulator with PAS, ATPase and Fis domain
MPKNILVTWIGNTDLRAMAQDLPADVRAKIPENYGSLNKEDRIGPVKTAISNRSFDRIYLISNYSHQTNQLYKKWLQAEPEMVSVDLKNPTDYKSVYKVTEAALADIVLKNKDFTLNILLSPGTPAMTAIFVLLGKTKYPAKFLQTYKNQVSDAEIPFDITIDVLQDLFNDADNSLEQLTRLSPHEVPGFEKIIGNSKSIRLAVGRAQRAALRDITVLLTGESGTGKELFARAIHVASRRKDKPFLTVNCAAIPKELLESELFGHAKGAFTGATNEYDGAFKRADGGILFLDEIGECTPEIQAKLLRVMQPIAGQHACIREIQPVGAHSTIPVDVRIIAATNKDLLDLVEKGVFRSDLYYRLAVITINLPPLRERKSDVEAIAQSMLTQINEDFAKQEPGYKHKFICDNAKNFVKSYSWPGNARELYNVLIQAAVMSSADGITKTDLSQCVAATGCNRTVKDMVGLPLGDGFSLDSIVDKVQKHYIELALEETHGVKAQAARLLGISNYQTLDARIKRLGITGAE